MSLIDVFKFDRSLTDKVIVLDLDESLVHSISGKTEETDFKLLTDLEIMTKSSLNDLKKRIYILKIDDCHSKGMGDRSHMWGIKRPHLDDFLNFCFSYFKIVAIWSAGSHSYVDILVEKLFNNINRSPHIIYSRKNITNDPHHGYHKPLIKMINGIPGLDQYMSLSNTFILDDRDSNFYNNEENGIKIPYYLPEVTIEGLRKDDLQLVNLQHWFNTDQVKYTNDVRKIDKKGIFSTGTVGQQMVLHNNRVVGLIEYF